jgi:G3E family GTPase
LVFDIHFTSHCSYEYSNLFHPTMADHPYNSSDLNSVLQTLSSLASLNSSQNTSIAQRETPPVQRQQQNEVRSSERPHSHPPRSSTGTPTTDPTTITTWPAALRYVMRTVGQNEETQLRIRGLIRSQHNHERQWWKGRETLLEKQQARGDRKKELDAVLYVLAFRSYS